MASEIIDVERRNRVPFMALLSGVLVSLIAQIMLIVLGGAIGLTIFGAEASAETGQGVGIGALVWLLLSLCVSAFLGAVTAAGVAHAALRRDGVLNGVVTWAAVSLLGLFLVTNALTGTVRSALGIGAQAAQTAAETVGQNPQLQQQAQQKVEQNQQQIEGQLGAAATEAQAAIQNPENQEKVATGAAIGLWGLFALHLFPLLAAIAGGAVAARRERRVEVVTVNRGFVPREPLPQS
jgi:hypothetical protein